MKRAWWVFPLLFVVAMCGGDAPPRELGDGGTHQRLGLGPDPSGGFIPGGAGGAGGGITSINVGSGLGGNGVSTPLTTSLSVGSGLAGNGSSSTLTTSLNVGSGVAGNGSATPLTLNMSATTCGSGQVLVADTATGGFTCGAAVPNSYSQTHFEWIDDWLAQNSATATNPADLGTVWQQAVAGTNAAIQGTSGVTQRPGIVEFTSGTVATNKVAITTSQTAVNFGDGSWSFRWVGGVPTLSTGTDTYADIIGFFDSTTAINITDGCYFLYDEGNVATGAANSGNANKLECWCASNATRTHYLMDGSTVSDESFTTVNAPVAAVSYPNTNILNLLVKMTGTTRAEFFVNGTKSCDISTNIPSGSARLTGAGFMVLKSAGTTNTTALDTDFTDLAVDLTSARSP